jgi:hypothetical protein
MDRNFTALMIGNSVLHGFIYAAILAVTWIGWIRHRRAGYLVLVFWALTALIGVAAIPFINLFAQRFIRDAFPATPVGSLSLAVGFLFQLISSACLLTGMAMLVFGRQAASSVER